MVLLVAVAALVAFVATRGSSGLTAAPNSVVALEPSGSISASVPVGARPVAIASGANALWVANLDDQTVTKVDVTSRQALRTIPVGGAPTALAASGNAVWVTHGNRDLSKIDATYNRPILTRPFATTGFFGADGATRAGGLRGDLDRRSRRRRLAGRSRIRLGSPESVGVGNSPSAIAAGAGSVWVTNSSDGTVTRIDPSTLCRDDPRRPRTGRYRDQRRRRLGRERR